MTKREILMVGVSFWMGGVVAAAIVATGRSIRVGFGRLIRKVVLWPYYLVLEAVLLGRATRQVANAIGAMPPPPNSDALGMRVEPSELPMPMRLGLLRSIGRPMKERIAQMEAARMECLCDDKSHPTPVVVRLDTLSEAMVVDAVAAVLGRLTSDTADLVNSVPPRMVVTVNPTDGEIVFSTRVFLANGQWWAPSTSVTSGLPVKSSDEVMDLVMTERDGDSAP